jgi:hypothetical protein
MLMAIFRHGDGALILIFYATPRYAAHHARCLHDEECRFSPTFADVIAATPPIFAITLSFADAAADITMILMLILLARYHPIFSIFSDIIADDLITMPCRRHAAVMSAS